MSQSRAGEASTGCRVWVWRSPPAEPPLLLKVQEGKPGGQMIGPPNPPAPGGCCRQRAAAPFHRALLTTLRLAALLAVEAQKKSFCQAFVLSGSADQSRRALCEGQGHRQDRCDNIPVHVPPRVSPPGARPSHQVWDHVQGSHLGGRDVFKRHGSTFMT